MANPNSNRRILAEIQKLSALAGNPDSSGEKFVIDRSPLDDSSTNTIVGRIFPKTEPFNTASFPIEIKFPNDYPFKPPEIRFLAPVYHPNVDEKGEICVALLNQGGAYRPTTQVLDIVKTVIHIIDNPDVDHSLIPEIGQEYASNRSKFIQTARAKVQQHGHPRS